MRDTLVCYHILVSSVVTKGNKLPKRKKERKKEKRSTPKLEYQRIPYEDIDRPRETESKNSSTSICVSHTWTVNTHRKRLTSPENFRLQSIVISSDNQMKYNNLWLFKDGNDERIGRKKEAKRMNEKKKVQRTHMRSYDNKIGMRLSVNAVRW